MEKLLYSFSEACAALNIGRNTLYDLLKTKKIHAFQIGRVWRVPAAEIYRYIAEQMAAKAAE